MNTRKSKTNKNLLLRILNKCLTKIKDKKLDTTSYYSHAIKTILKSGIPYTNYMFLFSQSEKQTMKEHFNLSDQELRILRDTLTLNRESSADIYFD
jgi:hypothetical protein